MAHRKGAGPNHRGDDGEARKVVAFGKRPSSLNTNLPQTATRQQWAERITRAFQKTVAAVIETGEMLLQAKAAMAHGTFIRMIKADLPFSHETAWKFMKIAGHPVLTNIAQRQYLPASWTTLFELSRLPETALLEAIKAESVHPEMGRQEAERLAEQYTRRLAERVAEKITIRDAPRQITSASMMIEAVSPEPSSIELKVMREEMTATEAAQPSPSASEPEELALLREFASFVIERTEGMKVDPEDYGRWNFLREQIKAILRKSP